MGVLELVALFSAGILGGAINAMAGGGTLFTFPVLLWVGLPPIVANATNMVALLPANFAALPAFRTELARLRDGLARLLAVGVVGGVGGALLVLALGNDIFAWAVPYLIALATIIFAFAPAIRHAVLKRSASGAGHIFPMTVLFISTLYGGYFGAGLGQVLLASMILIGYEDMREANAMKNAVSSVVYLTAVIVFAASASVAWIPALVMFVGATLGGYLGGLLSVTIPQRALRYGIIGFGIFLTLVYFVRGV